LIRERRGSTTGESKNRGRKYFTFHLGALGDSMIDNEQV
jgi:hypothetical protein